MRSIRKLSVVIPVYYNQENLYALYQDLNEKLVANISCDYEFVLVDDSSGDNSWEILRNLAKMDSHVRIMKLSRNFGSHAAIMCGLAHTTGDFAIVKAADLQEPTELALELAEKWRAGNNVVLAVREDREDKSLFSELYYWMVRKAALPQMPKGGFDTFLVDRKVIEVLERMDETNSAITGQILWSGFKTAQVPYVRLMRTAGKSRWTLKKKIRLVSDTLFSFSTLPIRLVSIIGFLSFLGSLIWALVVLVSKLTGGIEVTGFTTQFIFNLFSFGVTMLSLGIIGGYLWRTFDSSRNRPQYIIEEKMNENEQPASTEQPPSEQEA